MGGWPIQSFSFPCEDYRVSETADVPLYFVLFDLLRWCVVGGETKDLNCSDIYFCVMNNGASQLFYS